MSFVNLLANDIWSEADIVRRTEAMIRSEFSIEAETILNRKVLSSNMGTYVLTPEDQAQMLRYAQVAQAAQDAGMEARADMELLSKTMVYEAAVRRLEQPVIEDDIQDEAERADATAIIDDASEEVLALYEQRNPPSTDEPIETASMLDEQQAPISSTDL